MSFSNRHMEQSSDSISVLKQKRGILIVTEGMDASGKTTGTNLLAQHLKNLGMPLVQTREVGGTEFGEHVRALIFNSQKPVDPLARMLAVLAARQQHVSELIQPNIAKGISVLSDRFFDTTWVYQGVIDGLMPAYDEFANSFTLKHLFRRPEVLIYFKVSAAVAIERSKTRTGVDNDQYKRQDELLMRTASAYDDMFARLSADYRAQSFVIDANQNLESVDMQLAAVAKVIVDRYER